MLDSLMGSTRSMDLKEAKKKKGQNFKEDKACKFYLLGFCPQYEDIFKNTKKGHLQIGDCDKLHSDALVDEFNACPDKLYYEKTYARDMVRYLESLTRKVDEVVKRVSSNIREANKELAESGATDTAKRQIDMIREECTALLAEAEELAEKGDIEGSKVKSEQYEETKARMMEYEAKAKEPMKEEVCECCGLRLGEEGEGIRAFTHTEGRVHLGFVKIREWLAKLKTRLDEIEAEREKKKGERDKDDPDKEGDKAIDDDIGQNERRRDGVTRISRGHYDREDERRSRRGGGGDYDREDRGSDRRDARGGERGNERRGDRGGDRGGDRRGGGNRGDDRRGRDDGYSRGRGYDDGYGRARSRSDRRR